MIGAARLLHQQRMVRPPHTSPANFLLIARLMAQMNGNIEIERDRERERTHEFCVIAFGEAYKTGA